MYDFYNNLPFGVMIIDTKLTNVIFVNERFKKFFNVDCGVTGKSVKHISFFDKISELFIDNDIYDNERELIEVELISSRFYNIILKKQNQRFELFYYDITNSVFEKQKQIDIKEHKLKAEREKFLSISTELKTKCDIIEILRDREKEHLMHLKDVINNISEGLMVIDNKGRFSLCNRAAYNITKLNMGELINKVNMGKKYFIYNSEENTEDVDVIYNEYYKKNIPINNLTLKLVDKIDLSIKYLELNSNPILNRANEVLYTIVTIKDVTESKIHQINAEEQANFVRNVVNTIDVPIAVLEYPELQYKLINKKYDSMMKYKFYTDDDIIGKSINEVFFSNMDENLQKIVFYVGERGHEYTYSPCSIIDENGNERFYKFKFMPYKNSKDSVTRIHIHGLDITDEVNHSIELEKVTKLKDEFFTVISHELRTPLTIIYSSLQLATDIYGSEITPNIDKTLFRINQNCSRLLKLINNILDLSKAEAGFLELSNISFDIVYITEFIVNSVNLYAKSKGIELIFDTNEEECEVNLDKDKYEKILLNLLSNAIKFTPEGKQILVELQIENETVALSVKDQGIGIPDNKIDFIFDRFVQINTSLSRRAEGTGIGLSLVKKLVELMEGDIKVKSKEGKGTEFIMKFKKQGGQTPSTNNLVRLDSSMSDKIHIEFSDIN